MSFYERAKSKPQPKKIEVPKAADDDETGQPKNKKRKHANDLGDGDTGFRTKTSVTALKKRDDDDSDSNSDKGEKIDEADLESAVMDTKIYNLELREKFVLPYGKAREDVLPLLKKYRDEQKAIGVWMKAQAVLLAQGPIDPRLLPDYVQQGQDEEQQLAEFGEEGPPSTGAQQSSSHVASSSVAPSPQEVRLVFPFFSV